MQFDFSPLNRSPHPTCVAFKLSLQFFFITNTLFLCKLSSLKNVLDSNQGYLPGAIISLLLSTIKEGHLCARLVSFFSIIHTIYTFAPSPISCMQTAVSMFAPYANKQFCFISTTDIHVKLHRASNAHNNKDLCERGNTWFFFSPHKRFARGTTRSL